MEALWRSLQADRRSAHDGAEEQIAKLGPGQYQAISEYRIDRAMANVKPVILEQADTAKFDELYEIMGNAHDFNSKGFMFVGGVHAFNVYYSSISLEFILTP